MNARKYLIAIGLFVVTAFSQISFAQGLNWEGQTGALITPFAYTIAATKGRFSKPEVGFHYLNSGNVIGNDYQFSITEGFSRRVEFGYTGAFSSWGSSPLSYLFSNGYSELHGKLMVLDENARNTKWIPAVSVGAIGRFGEERVSYYVTGENFVPGASDKNGDFYIVATKTITQLKVPFVLSIGDKVTNASLMGIAGNAGNAKNSGQRWQGRLFGAAAFAIKGPAKSALAIGAEVLQEPRYIQGLNVELGANATIPTTLSYFVRFVPHIDKTPLQIDLAVVQAAGRITPDLPTLNARARVGMGISYHF